MLVIDKFLPRNANNTIDVATPWFDLNAKAGNLVEDIAAHNATQLGKIESYINGITDAAATASVSAANSAATAATVETKLAAFMNYQGEYTAKAYSAKQSVSVNGSFYTATANVTAAEAPGVSPKWTLTAEKIKNTKITKPTKNGHGGFGVLLGGELYTTSGNPWGTGVTPPTTLPAESAAAPLHNFVGRGLAGEIVHYGLDALKRVPLPAPMAKGSLINFGVYGAYGYALYGDGDLYMWGKNPMGQTGVGHANPLPLPTIVAQGVMEVYAHPTHNESDYTKANVVIRKNDGLLYGSGANQSGALGVGTSLAKMVWTRLSPIDRGVWDVKGVYAQGDGVSENGLLYVANVTPTVGTAPSSSTQWTKVGALDAIGANPKRVFVIGANGSIFALTADGRIVASGANTQGQLGTGDTLSKLLFTDVTQNWAGVTSGVKDIKVVGGTAISGTTPANKGSIVMLITLSDDTKIVKACGDNTYGQLGDGTTTARTIPVTPLKSDNVVDIAGFGAGMLTVQALKSDKSVWAWGHNKSGELGDGTLTNRSVAIQIESNVAALLSDGLCANYGGELKQSFLLKDDGSLWACGSNKQGELATGDYLDRVSHVKCAITAKVLELGRYVTMADKTVYMAVCENGEALAWGSNAQGGVSGKESASGVNTPTAINLPNTGAK